MNYVELYVEPTKDVFLMTKNELLEYSEILKEIKDLEDEINTLYYRITSPRLSVINDMPGGGGSGSFDDKIGKNLDKYNELLEIYEAKKSKLLEKQIAIEKAIGELEPKKRRLIRYRYLKNMSWEEVCVKMQYSWSQVHRLHHQALIDLLAI